MLKLVFIYYKLINCQYTNSKHFNYHCLLITPGHFLQRRVAVMLIQQQGLTLPLQQSRIICSSTEALKLFSDHSADWVGRSKDKSHILSLGTPIKSDSQHLPLPLCFPQAIWLPDKICTNNKSINQATARGKGFFSPPLPFINRDIFMEMFYVFYFMKIPRKILKWSLFPHCSPSSVHNCRWRSSHKMQRDTGIERSQSNQQEKSSA